MKKTLLGNPWIDTAKDANFVREMLECKRGSTMNVHTMNNNDIPCAVIIFFKSLRQKYLHDILYAPKQKCIISLKKTKKGKALKNIDR